MESVITLTMNPSVDVNTSIDNVVPERKLRCGEYAYEPGGGGLNVSKALSKLGSESFAYFTHGGRTGLLLNDLISKEDINSRGIPIQGWTRQNFIVLEKNTDQQYRFGAPGPRLERVEWDRALETVLNHEPKPGYLVASGSLPPGVPDDFYARLVRRARERDIRVALDTSGTPLVNALQAGPFLVKPNFRELRLALGKDLSEEKEQEDAVADLVATCGCALVVVSLGAAGVLAGTRDGVKRFRAPTVKIRSTVGAGDSTVAGMVFQLARGKSLSEAVCYGVAAGSAAVMTPGTELCRKEDADRLFEVIVCSASL